MKTIYIAVFLLIFSIISIPLYLVEFIIGKINPQLKAKTSQHIVVFAFHLILKGCGIKKTVIGLDNIPKDEAVLYTGNHRSYFDILIAYTSVPTLTGFVAKKEMLKIPCISIWMKYLNCIFLDRNDVKQALKTTLKGIEHIKNGYSMFISPEGTRNKEEELLPFKEGSFKMAEKTGCAIIPVSMNNNDAIFEKHMPWVRKAHVVIEFGKPIYPGELSTDDRRHLGSYVRTIIETTLEKNSSLV